MSKSNHPDLGRREILRKRRKVTNFLFYPIVRGLCSSLSERIRNPEALESVCEGVSSVMNLFCVFGLD